MDPRYTIAQQYLGWWPWTPKWSCPPADDTSTLARDTRRCRPADMQPAWPATLASVPVRFGGNVRPSNEGTLSGKPVVSGGDRGDVWNVHPVPTWANNGYEQVVIPRPRSRYWWVEGYPARDGAWDRRMIVVHPDGAVTETILTAPDFWKIARFARYWPDGTLAEGFPITNGGRPQFHTILAAAEPDHRLAIGLPEYAKGVHDNGGVSDGEGLFDWPRSGGLLRLTDAAYARTLATTNDPEVLRVARMLNEFGAYVDDRSGPKVRHAAIECQTAVFSKVWWPWTLSDFEAAVDA